MPPRGGVGGSAPRASTDGLVIVDKPAGRTSHDVVARIRRLAGTRRVGHAGTLDPMATGVLVIGVGKATRLLGHLALTEKQYLATIRLGQSTDTGDAEGTVLAGAPASGLTGPGIQAAADSLTGDIQQVPPAVSAVKVNGQRAYRLARQGRAPALPPRPVTVSQFRITAIRPAGELLDADAEVTCSSGTYVRALARDLGEALGTGGHLTMLRRTRVGHYDVSAARTLDQLTQRLEVVPLAAAAADAFPAWRLTSEQAGALSHGATLAMDGAAVGGAGPVAAFGPDGTLIALVEERAGLARPVAVFVP
ncbi:MAG: tRNA pseudouridine(55) synthase TruB [Actinobacteria bacterium]|nr:tRNA pseudouridine(55) synthase TruB [Actinomycetota bacterium]